MKKYRNVLNEKIGDSKKTYSKKEEEKRKKENKEKSNKKDSTADNIDVDDLKKIWHKMVEVTMEMIILI